MQIALSELSNEGKQGFLVIARSFALQMKPVSNEFLKS